MATNNDPIGIFDSGVGGLSIWKEIHQLLPQESAIYLADSKNAPYGDKGKDEIVNLSIKNTEHLLSSGCKLIVVACNTATTNAISYLRTHYSVPFIGIEPATKPAAIATKTGKIGILATKGTLASELFLNTSAKYRGEVEIIETIGTGLVAIIESGEVHKAIPLLESYLNPMVEKGIDNLVLGCTHYPFLTDLIKEIVPEHINIIDSGEPVARRTASVLQEQGLAANQNNGQQNFFTNSNLEVLLRFLEKLEARAYTAKYLDF